MSNHGTNTPRPFTPGKSMTNAEVNATLVCGVASYKAKEHIVISNDYFTNFFFYPINFD